jgi:hypothetical protein
MGSITDTTTMVVMETQRSLPIITLRYEVYKEVWDWLAS